MKRMFKHIDNATLEFYLDGEDSYCLVNGERSNTGPQYVYEYWINNNGAKLTEIKDLYKKEIKKHTMTE